MVALAAGEVQPATGVVCAAAGEVASRTVIGVLESLEKSRLDRPIEDALAESVASGNDRIGFVADVVARADPAPLWPPSLP
jgi:hypothetical protein